MEDEELFLPAPVVRPQPLLPKITLIVYGFALLVVLSVVVQAVLGDDSLSREGGLWSAIAQPICRYTAWSSACTSTASWSESASASPSTSTSTSTSI